MYFFITDIIFVVIAYFGMVSLLGVLNTGVMLIPEAGKARQLLDLWWTWAEAKERPPDVKQYLFLWPVEQQVLVCPPVYFCSSPVDSICQFHFEGVDAAEGSGVKE